MSQDEHGYDRGWHRYGFETMPFISRTVHNGGKEMTFSLAFNRGPFKPYAAYGIIEPGSQLPDIGMHIHRDDPTGEDVEEWYIMIEGTGIQRFTNGDSVEVGPGDMIAVYPGTGHSFEATGDTPVKMIAILPRMFTNKTPVGPSPENLKPRIEVLTTVEAKNPLTARCSVCGASWERPEGDEGSNTIADWSVEHDCTEPFSAVHLKRGE